MQASSLSLWARSFVANRHGRAVGRLRTHAVARGVERLHTDGVRPREMRGMDIRTQRRTPHYDRASEFR